MSFTTNPTGKSPSLNGSGDTGQPSRFQSLKEGIGSGLSTISQYETVKTVRNSTVWYVISYPFSAFGSFVGAIWTRISNKIWGLPSVTKETVKLTEQGWFWGASTYEMPTEVALRQGKLTYEQGIKDSVFTEESAKTNGWVSVEIPGRFFGSSKMLLKDAVEGGYLTIEKAIAEGHITESHAEQANWVKKTSTT